MNEFIAAFATLLLATITGLFYNRLLKRERMSRIRVIQNLPALSSQYFIGRIKEISLLHELLRPTNPNTIAGVFGIGGIGKTSLLIEIGQEYIRSKSFDLILYVPIRQISLLNTNDKRNHILDIIISTAVYTLDFQQSKLSNAEKETFIRASFFQKRTLLLVDGLEETCDKEQNELLSFLESLPSQTKVIISSRSKINLPFSILLNALTYDECRTLISKEITSTNTAKLNDSITEKLYQLTGGIPLLVKLVVSYLKDYSIDTVLNKLQPSRNTLFESVIDPVINKYRGKRYHKILMTIALLPNLASISEIAVLAP